jgi:membrane-associated PAP2 superfamily phosphatase
MQIRTQLLLTLIILLGVFFLFEFTPIDLIVEDSFYNNLLHTWLLPRQKDAWAALLFYSGVKFAIILFGLGMLAAYIYSFKDSEKGLKCYRTGLLTLVLSLILVPSIIGVLKSVSDVPCPCDVLRYGGEHPYFQVLDVKPVGVLKQFRCFPAGHASGGFALMSLFFMFKQKRHKMAGLGIGLMLGWSMGLYKMFIGDHYLSHTIISMLLAWLIILLIHMILQESTITHLRSLMRRYQDTMPMP